MKNEYKKRDSEGNKLPDEIGKGLTEHWVKIEPEISELNDSIMSFKLPEELKDKFTDCCDNSSEVLRSFVRGYVQLKKQ